MKRLRLAELSVAVGTATCVVVLSSACRSPEPELGRVPAELFVLQSTRLSGDLAGVVGVVRTSSGAVVIAEQRTASLLVLRSGREPITIGRAGDGPGEFRLLHRLYLCPSDLVVVQDYAGKVHVVRDTSVVRTVPLPRRLDAAELVGCGLDDVLTFVKMPVRIPGTGLQSLPLTVIEFDTESGRLDEIGTLRGIEMFISERFSAFYERPFGTLSLIASGPSGTITAESHRLELQRFTRSGTEVVYSSPTQPRTATRSDRSRYTRERIAEEPDSASRITLRGVLEELPWGERLPEVDRLMVSQSGAFWLRRAPSAKDSLAEWLVINDQSELVHRILLDRSLRVKFADATRILALRETADGFDELLELVVGVEGSDVAGSLPRQ